MSNTHPGTDRFRNSPPYGNYPDLYLRTAFFGAPAETFSGYGLEPTPAQLHTGHFGLSGNVVADSFRVAGVKDQVFGLSDKKIAGFVYRNFKSVVDMEVSMSFRAERQLGSQIDEPEDAFVAAILGARIQGTPTLTSIEAVNISRVDWPDGYYFLLANDTGGMRFFIVKMAAGAASVLSSTPASVTQTAYALNIRQPTKLIFRAEDDGAGGVNLSGHWVAPSSVRISGLGFEQGNGTATAGFEALVLSANDPSGSSPHTGSGRFGFGVNTERGDGSTWGTANLIDFFQIRRLSDGEVLVRDEWLRSEGRFTADVVSNFVTGKNLLQSWFSDHFFSDPNGRLDRNAVSAGVDTVVHSPSGVNANEDGGGLFLSTRPAFSPVAQRRSWRFQVSNSAGMSLGIWLRYGKTSFNPNDGPSAIDLAASGHRGHQGYLFLITNTAGSTFTIELWRYTDAGRALLAESTLGATGPLDDTLDFEAINENGQVRLTATWDAGAFVWTNIQNGASAPASGIATSIYDASSDRILSGVGEGYWIAGLNAQAVTVVEWVEEAPSEPGTPPGESQPSVNLHDELFESSGTLSVPGTWPVEIVSDGYRTHQRFTESLHLASVSREVVRGRVWRINMSGATESERDTVRTFWRDHRGPVRAFDWVEPITGTTVKVLLGQAMFDSTKVASDNYSMGSFLLVEVR